MYDKRVRSLSNNRAALAGCNDGPFDDDQLCRQTFFKLLWGRNRRDYMQFGTLL